MFVLRSSAERSHCLDNHRKKFSEEQNELKSLLLEVLKCSLLQKANPSSGTLQVLFSTEIRQFKLSMVLLLKKMVPEHKIETLKTMVQYCIEEVEKLEDPCVEIFGMCFICKVQESVNNKDEAAQTSKNIEVPKEKLETAV